MTTPRHGSRSSPRRREDWSMAAWGWDKAPDPAHHRRLRRLQRAQRLANLRADVARAALRHPSMVELPGEDPPGARAAS